jgi:putative flippase GtrA
VSAIDLRDRPLGGQFLRYCLVGSIGFLIDAGIVELLVRLDWTGLYLGRVLSYLVGATATWWLNRRFTFRRHGAWAPYVIANAFGAGLNYAIYVVVLAILPQARALPSLAVAAGSAVALLFNFSVNRWLVFRRR